MRSLVICLCLLLMSSAFAETPRGRLPDGRAFRTDAQGMELIDYTAELEVTVDTLQRQVASLSEELETKSREAAGLRAGANARLSERDIVVDERESAPPVAVKTAAAACAPVECPEPQVIERFRACPKTASAPVSCPALSCPETSCSEAVHSAIIERDRELERARLALNDTNGRMRKLEAELVQARRASETVKAASADDGRARFASIRSAAVRGMQQSVVADAASLAELVRQRDVMASQSSAPGTSGLIGFKMQPATTRSGRSIADIERDLAVAVDARQVVALRTQLQEIRGRVQQDIAFMRRVRR